MRIGMTLPSMVPGLDRRTILEWCRRIDDGPFHSLAVGERVTYPNAEMFSLLAVAAAVTERVRLVATVTVLPLHSAALVAKQAATIDVVSGGRLTLGVGVGGREADFRAAAAPFERRHQRLDEQVALLQRVWAGEPPAEGLEPIGPPPVQPGGPPLLAGAMGPRAIGRASRWAAGVAGFVTDPAPGPVAAGFDAVREAWVAAGRSDAPYLTTSFWYGLGDDGAVRARRYGYRYLRIFGDEFARAMADSVTMVSADALRRGLDGLEESGCDEVYLVPTTADLAELDRTLHVLASR